MFRVGPAGQDCLALSSQQLLFDSDGGKLNGIYLHGHIPTASFTTATTNNGGGSYTYTLTYTLSFGTTLANPRVYYCVQDPATPTQVQPSANYDDFLTGSGGGDNLATAGRQYLYTSFQLNSTSVVFQVQSLVTSGGQHYAYALDFYYMIFYG